MGNVSVPLSAEEEQTLNGLVVSGSGSSRADVMRRALGRYAEEEAVYAVLRAEQEAREGKLLRGDPREVLMG